MAQKLAIMQPTYLPWAGYFSLIDWADTFVFLDDVQFNRQSWQQRNKIKTSDGPIWLTVPVRKTGRRGQMISEVEICNDQPWRRKHRKSIKLNYSDASYWDHHSSFVEQIYEDDWEMLADLNISLIKKLSSRLGIESIFHRSSQLPVEPGGRTDVTVSMCSYFDANEFLSPLGAVDFHAEDDLFSNTDTRIFYQHFDHPEYEQLHGDFESHMSVIDLLLNEGPVALAIIREGSNGVYSPDEAIKAAAGG